MENLSDNTAGNGTMENLNDLAVYFQQFNESVSNWKKQVDAQTALLHHALDISSKCLEMIEKMRSGYGLVSNSVDVPEEENGTRSKSPSPEKEPAENGEIDDAELRAKIASTQAVVQLTPIRNEDVQKDDKKKAESPSMEKRKATGDKRKAETSPTENSSKLRRRPSTRSSAVAPAQDADLTPKTRKAKGKKAQENQTPSRVSIRLLRRKSTFN